MIVTLERKQTNDTFNAILGVKPFFASKHKYFITECNHLSITQLQLIKNSNLIIIFGIHPFILTMSVLYCVGYMCIVHECCFWRSNWLEWLFVNLHFGDLYQTSTVVY